MKFKDLFIEKLNSVMVSRKELEAAQWEVVPSDVHARTLSCSHLHKFTNQQLNGQKTDDLALSENHHRKRNSNIQQSELGCYFIQTNLNLSLYWWS